ncbi:MAG: dihydrofolate reductase [Candidatus Tokpelaia sp. JSC188]|nr:MAG: dihydrofolate reductase [Candidatus Tokpelaia sp. JSC188]
MNVVLSLIAAVGKNSVIGHNNAMPWRLSTDLKRFKTLTLSKPVIMGRKTWNSIARPLPNRLNIIITRDRSFRANGAIIAYSFKEGQAIAQREAKKKNIDEIFVIGGGEIFREALPFAARLHITEILAILEGDTYFPIFDLEKWRLALSEMVPASKKDSHPTRYSVYESNLY